MTSSTIDPKSIPAWNRFCGSYRLTKTINPNSFKKPAQIKTMIHIGKYLRTDHGVCLKTGKLDGLLWALLWGDSLHRGGLIHWNNKGIFYSLEFKRQKLTLDEMNFEIIINDYLNLQIILRSIWTRKYCLK